MDVRGIIVPDDSLDKNLNIKEYKIITKQCLDHYREECSYGF